MSINLKDVDQLADHDAEKMIGQRFICPGCKGPKNDLTRRYCAPCILANQSKKLNKKGV